MANEIVSLSRLAEMINAEHSACINSAHNAVVRAIEVGRLLVEAKDQVDDDGKRTIKHGQWTAWVEKNCGFSQRQAWGYMHAFNNKHLIERQIVGQTNDLTGLESLLKAIREAKAEEEPEPWTKSEITRKKAVESGHAVVANIKTDLRLIEWAQEEGLFVRIDRSTDWGNPFLIPDDGEREEVIEAYQVYLGYKPSLSRRYDELRGKVLGCWCYPEECHGNVLIREAHGECADDEAERVGCHK